MEGEDYVLRKSTWCTQSFVEYEFVGIYVGQ